MWSFRAVSILTALRRDQSASIGLVMAMFLVIAVGATALAVDIGSLYLERRTAQGAVDIASLAAASDLERAEDAAAATLAANNVAVRSLAVTKGRYAFDATLAPNARFVPGQQPYNAARVDATLGGHLYFAQSFMAEPEIGVSAIGTSPAMAAFSIGSRLASLNGGLLNSLLGALLGGNLNLSVMDYNALADAHVELVKFLPALASELGVTAGTYSDLLRADASVASVLRAAATVLSQDGSTQAALALSSLASKTNASLDMSLKSLVDLGPLGEVGVGQESAALDADLNAMSLVSAAAALANGDHQVAVNLGASVPGLLSLTLDLAIGEPMQNSGWVTVGEAGATVKTAQTRLRLVAEVGGGGVLAGVRIRLPIYIEIASAEARLKEVTCQGLGQSGGSTKLDAYPSVVRAWIGEVNPSNLSVFSTSPAVSNAKLVQVPLISISASAFAQMSNASPTELSFSQSEIDGHVVKTAKTHDYLSSLTSSLLHTANIQINILGFGIGLGAVQSALLAALNPVTTLLDGLLAPLLETLGISLGEVDVQVNGLRCGSGVLAG